MLKSSVPKSSIIFNCKFCHYDTSRLSQYNRHILTPKHIKNEKSTDFNNLSTDFNKKSSEFVCHCGKEYKERTGLWRHKKVCKKEIIEKEKTVKQVIDTEELTEKELIVMLLKQNSQLIEQNNELTKNVYNTTNNNTTNNTNSHNKSFNLNFFLNETCKDAMNIMDFVDSIKIQLSDLEKVGELGYVDGISNIIIKNLKALDITKRPVHCTDRKRETMYIRHDDKWEKDEEQKTMHKVVRKVAWKNQNSLQMFRDAHPDCGKYHSKFSDQYNKLIVESMGGAGDNELEKEDKIIKKISKEVVVDK